MWRSTNKSVRCEIRERHAIFRKALTRLRPRNRRHHPRFEALDGRTLLASNLTATLLDGLLRVEGTEAADRIVLTRSTSDQVGVQGTTISYQGVPNSDVPSSLINRIEIWGLGGDDWVVPDAAGQAITVPMSVNGGGGVDRLQGAAGADYLDGGALADSLYGSAGADTLVGVDVLTAALGEDGVLRVEGTEGADRVTFDRAADGQIGVLQAATLYRGVLNSNLPASAFRRIEVRARGGDDTVGPDAAGQAITVPMSVNGGGGVDRLQGAAGADTLQGGDGNDGLFGGAGNDTVYGGNGADRFLAQAGDSIADLSEADARIDFANGSWAWADGEILSVDQGLARLHARTNNTRLLKLSSGGALRVVRDVSLGTNVLANNNSVGTIRFADLAFTTDQSDSPAWATMIHEIGHNWDTAGENGAFNFGWFNAQPGYVSWYAPTNQHEDFAETLVATFLANSRYHPENAPAKVSSMNLWLNSMTS
jgi:Ca2+-binding RTX toxin-like protein